MHNNLWKVTMPKSAPVVLFLLLFLAVPFTTSGEDFSVSRVENTVVHSDAFGVTLDFDMNEAETRDLNIGEEVNTVFPMYGAGATYDYGKPILPLVSKFVIIPPDVGVELLIETGEAEIIQADHPPALCLDEEFIENRVEGDENRLEIYPPVVAKMSEPTVIRGVRLVKVTTYPVQYDPANNTFIRHRNIRTEIRYTDNSPVNPATHPRRRDRSREFMKFINALAVNGGDLNRDEAEFLSPYTGHYLVVAHENCVNPARPFIEWRRKAGYKVDIFSVPSNQASNTNAIKSGIRSRYNEYLEAGVDPFDQVLLIGDRQDHQGCGPASQWILQAEVGESVWGNPPHADYKYALLEGNDIHMDVAISRWASGNPQLMGLNVGRTLGFEMEPYMENTSWFTRGGVGSYHWGNSATSAWHVTVNTNVRWGEEVLKFLNYDEIRFYEDYVWDQRANNYGPWARDIMNDGANVMMVRAENYFWRSGFGGVQNDRVVFPIRLNTCGHGEWSTWWMTRTGDGDNLKGPVATTCGWGGPPTAPMSVAWLSLVKGVMLHDMTFGWGKVFAVTNFENFFEDVRFRNIQVFSEIKTDLDAYGDPGVQPWRRVPLQYGMEFPDVMTPQTRTFEVYVFDPEIEDIDEAAVEGARVTLYVPGDLPDDNDDYAEHEVFSVTGFTNQEGIARFVFDNPQFEEGTMYVTLTGRDILPVLEEIEIEAADVAIELATYELIEIEGNDNGDINPGEEFRLNLTAVNTSDGVEIEAVIGMVTSLSSWVEVENNEVTFGTIDAGEEADGESGITLIFHPSTPDGFLRPSTKPVLLIEFSSDENSWTSAISLEPIAPNFIVRSIPTGSIIPDTLTNLDIEIENIGRLNSSPLTGVIKSLGMGVGVVIDTAYFPAINAGSHARLTGEADFLVSGNTVVVPGSKTELMLILSNNDGFVDTTYFKLQVLREREGAPQGPDGYGYICFDDTDTDWTVAPEYDWIEICPDEEEFDFEGVEIEEFDGRSELDVGENAVLPLPFTTNFYGHAYDTIAVCTNGYICMGNQWRITNFQNWPMDQAFGAGAGMLAPFWDWLQLGNNGKVYYYYDEQDARFIVEWYRLRHKQGGNGDLTFQVVLYDADVWITESGDQNILFQYKSISQSQGPREGEAWEKNIPFASIGISSPDGTTGINYSFKNEEPITSAPIESQRALVFSTSPRYKACTLWGTVTDVADGSPIEGATVATKHGFVGITDSTGFWRINGALAEISFDITAHAQGYNDSTQYDFEVAENDTFEINFELLHPEFSPSDWNLAYVLDPGHEIDLEFTVQNTGNGPMDWTVDRRLIGDANAPPWQFRRTYFVGNDVEDTRICGVIFAENEFYVSGSGDYSPMIYRFSRNGEFIESFAQPVDSARNGMHDMAWDGEYIWGGVLDTLYAITLDGEVVHRFETEIDPTSNVAWDPDRRVFWVSTTTSDISAFTPEGELVDSLELSRKALRIYGLAYWQDDPDHYPLYAYHKDRVTDLPMIHKFNPVTGDTIRVAELTHENGGSPGGTYITNQFDVYSWVLLGTSNCAPVDGGDRLDIWQIDARKDWFQVDVLNNEEWIEAESGRLETTETADFILTFNSTDLPETTFVAELYFTHNADSGRGHILLELDVIGPEPPSLFDLFYPANGDTLDTTTVEFTWFPSFDPNFGEEVSYEFWLTAGEDTLSFELSDTTLTADFDTLNIDFNVMWTEGAKWWVNALSNGDVEKSNQSNQFYFREPSTLDGENIVPVEFTIASIYPSPFNSTTTIRFGADVSERTVLRVFDLTGRQVDVLYDRTPVVGWHSVVWDASRLSSGVYLLRLESMGRAKIAKTAVIK